LTVLIHSFSLIGQSSSMRIDNTDDSLMS